MNSSKDKSENMESFSGSINSNFDSNYSYSKESAKFKIISSNASDQNKNSSQETTMYKES